MQMRSVHHTGFTVSDLERSIAFYRDVLGLKLIRRQGGTHDYLGKVTGFPGVDLRIAIFQVSDDQDHILELLQYVSHPAEPTPRETNRPGNGHLAFVVDDAGSAYRELRNAGVEMVNEPAEVTLGINAGGKAFYFRDPDGFTLEVIQRRPAD